VGVVSVAHRQHAAGRGRTARRRSPPPDLAISLRLDPFAPRAARHHVAQVDRPSPDLRNAVTLLTSELVTRAVLHDRSVAGASVELVVWMPRETVRIELHAACELIGPAARDPSAESDYDLLLLDGVADRWALDSDGRRACMWFEIDRAQEHGGAVRQNHGGV